VRFTAIVWIKPRWVKQTNSLLIGRNR